MPKDRAATGLARTVVAATGVKSYVRTVNDLQDASCLADLGVAGIYTDALPGLSIHTSMKREKALFKC